MLLADGEVVLAVNAGDVAVAALGAFGNAGQQCLYFSRDGFARFAPTVPGSIQMGFECADALSDGRERQKPQVCPSDA